MGRIGMGELIIIFVIILLLFGTKRLPEIGSAIGKAIREFKKAAKDIQDDVIELPAVKQNSKSPCPPICDSTGRRADSVDETNGRWGVGKEKLSKETPMDHDQK